MSANDELQAHTCEKMLQEYGNVKDDNIFYRDCCDKFIDYVKKSHNERVADTSKTLIVEKEVYEAVLRNSLRVCDLEKENEDLISRKNWCNARAKKILEKNKQLKQLLKECREYVVNTPVYPQCDNIKQAEIHRLVDKINEVIK